MPIGGGDHKHVGDGAIVFIRPDATLGNTDIWDLRDAIAAFVEMHNGVKGALAGAADFAAFKAAVALLPNLVQFIDERGPSSF
jgi:hypothetical protein